MNKYKNTYIFAEIHMEQYNEINDLLKESPQDLQQLSVIKNFLITESPLTSSFLKIFFKYCYLDDFTISVA